MQFSEFSTYLQKLEKTTSRNQMTVILADLLKEALLAEVDKICYLVLGRLGPHFLPVEFGISEKLMMRVLARALDQSLEEIEKLYKKVGDLGEVVEKLKVAIKNSKLDLTEVFDRLYAVAIDSGEGSQERKIQGLADLIRQLDSFSAKYLTRIPLGKLRLGFSDVTILDALSFLLRGDKTARSEIEAAYVKSADIGRIARLAKKGGLSGLEKIEIEVGVPIRPALSERLGSAEEIVEKLETFAVEPKMDGFRVQLHIDSQREFSIRSQRSEIGNQNQKSEVRNRKSAFLTSPASPRRSRGRADLRPQTSLFKEFGISQNIFVKIFSRNLEDTTAMFPDIVRAVQQLPVESAIFDGEAIAFNPETNEFLSFQETVQRKRKYGISQKVKDVPLKVFVFDLLYLNGRSLLLEPFSKRRQALAEILKLPKTSNLLNQTIQLTHQQVVDSVAKLHEFFDLYISEGLEGVMCKKLESLYQAGARNFNWVKFKRTTEGTGLADTIDAVVLGYYAGRGQRSRFGLGAFLVGILDEKSEKFVTLAKIGTGLTEEQWQEMYHRLQSLKIPQSPQVPKEYLVSQELTPDVWVKPFLVVEIKADEITRSPVHTAGLALRFPRLVSFRDDKNPQDATTVAEVVKLYKLQNTQKSVNLRGFLD